MYIRSIRSKSLSAQTDEQLLAAYRLSGDQRLASELFGRYLHLVHGLCMKYTEDPHDRSDLVMIIFEKVLADLPRSNVTSFNAWLYTLSRNECISWIRRRDRQTIQMEKWEIEKKSNDLIVENEAVERLYIEEEDLEARLEAALAQLDERQRLCIHLFFFEQQSYKEISRHTGLEVSDVKSHLQNGKRRLKGLLS